MTIGTDNDFKKYRQKQSAAFLSVQFKKLLILKFNIFFFEAQYMPLYLVC
jgi:hypothetical protein